MRVSKIVINSILGIDHLEIEPGSVTEITGANGSGKTSILESLKAIFGQGHDATLLRQGADKGEVVLLMDDGTEIQKSITAEKSSTTVKHPTYGKISKPATYLKKLADALSLNPVEFLTASKKDRVDTLLQAIPMTVTADKLSFVPVDALRGVDLDKHALEVISAIGKQIYDLRTGVNRAEKEKRATVSQMSETLPADAPEGGNWSETLTTLQDEFKALQQVASGELANLNKVLAAIKEDATAKHNAYRDGIKADLERDIEALRKAAEELIEKSETYREAAIEGANNAYTANRKAAEDRYRPKESELKERIGQARAMLEQSAKVEKTREFIGQLTADADRLEAESTKLTHALGQLEILKSGLLENLPIKGVEIRDGDLYVDGLPFDRVNESRRVRLAIEIAKLRAGELGLVAVDGLECLDPETYQRFRKEAEASGMQFVVARVSDGPLAINEDVA